MGKITASCGHEISWEWMDNPLSGTIRPRQAREGNPALSYAVECEECGKHGKRFATEAAADRWLTSASRRYRARFGEKP